MRNAFGSLVVFLCLSAIPAEAQIANFEHIVVVVQENRTPDNIFQGLCSQASMCSETPSADQYNIQTANWANKAESTGVTQPVPVALASTYDLDHSHTAFVRTCDLIPATKQCRMDGAASVNCSPAAETQCPDLPQYAYVDNSTGILNPYLTIAKQFAFANYMFQTNQGPSFPAHQFLFGATSAPSAADDHLGTFVSENPPNEAMTGCMAATGVLVQMINSAGIEAPSNKVYPCFEHQTLADLLTAKGDSWRYYTPLAGSLWTAPNAINHICEPSNQTCTGSAWTQNVDQKSADVLTDIANCNLRNVSWVIPSAGESDHAGGNQGRGPAWVASVVNAIGNSKCADKNGKTYWQTTAIVITWDDWGGWYDHVAPTIEGSPQGGYQFGFRVPMLFVSAYRRPGYISNSVNDFGSIARFIESNFSIPRGALTFADARIRTDLFDFYDLGLKPRQYKAIPSALGPSDFINDRSPQGAPDDD